MADTASPHSGANLLAQSASSYLRSAAHQPVHWRPWGAEAFAAAEAEDKPILLDSGAVWCHWCHVMDRESYEDAEIAEIINRLFIAVKVDRDERPEVDARYQAAVQAISGRGGWPLTAFLTPDGRPYFGGTYIPRHDRLGSPGFDRVLTTMAEVWRERREEAIESAQSVMAAIEHNENFTASEGELSPALVDKIVNSALQIFDPRHGGFGSQPKFPHPAAIDLLLAESRASSSVQNAKARSAAAAVATTLEKMARGGVYDQLAGGFHRYSVDERWVVPHFEKMLYDNTELLRNFLHAHQALGGEDFREVALDIMSWLDSTMTDRERGGFHASQDADISLDDDGDYFTWTEPEARAALRAADFLDEDIALVLKYWDIGELGDMHHNPAKNVLHVKQSASELAASSGRNAAEVEALLKRARPTLLSARAGRPTPYIDRTLYTGWNAMAVSAYLEAARLPGLDGARDFALLTFERLLSEAWNAETGRLNHVIAYADPAGAPPAPVAANLDDYAFTLHAALDAYAATGEMRYYRAAESLARTLLDCFEDKASGGFFDTPNDPDGEERLGALAVRRKPLQDSPTPAGNPTAAAALLRLAELSGDAAHRTAAERALQAFSGVVEHFGLYAGSYGLALKRLLTAPEQIVVVGEGLEADGLAGAAHAGFNLFRMVIRLSPAQLAAELPPALAETVARVPAPADQKSWALLCRDRACQPPIMEPEALATALMQNVDGAGSQQSGTTDY